MPVGLGITILNFISSLWILAANEWNDNGIWIDTEEWND